MTNGGTMRERRDRTSDGIDEGNPERGWLFGLNNNNNNNNYNYFLGLLAMKIF